MGYLYRGIKLFLILTATVLLNSCEHPAFEEEIPPHPGYSELEELIRSRYDFRAVFTWEQYSQLLVVLSDPRFVVLPINEMRKTFDNSRIVVGMRHDIDWNPFKAVEMALLEQEYGLRATYFILPTADYYGDISRSGLDRHYELDSLYIDLYNSGAEIGIHNDLLSVMIEYRLDPFIFNNNDLQYFRSLNIPIYGTASHGSPIARETVPNYQIFSDYAQGDSIFYRGIYYPVGRKSLSDYGFQYEAYFVPFNIYLSESGGRWNDPGGFGAILERLRNSVPGDRIQILTHPEWWGKIINN